MNFIRERVYCLFHGSLGSTSKKSRHDGEKNEMRHSSEKDLFELDTSPKKYLLKMRLLCYFAYQPGENSILKGKIFHFLRTLRKC